MKFQNLAFNKKNTDMKSNNKQHQFIYKHKIWFVLLTNFVANICDSICRTWEMSLQFTWVNVLHTFSHLVENKGCKFFGFIFWNSGSILPRVLIFYRKSEHKIKRIIKRIIESVSDHSLWKNQQVFTKSIRIFIIIIIQTKQRIKFK